MNTKPTPFHLVVVGGIHDGRVIPMRPPFLIGRAVECHLRPASTTVSLRHCVIEARDEFVFIRDLGSTNGTFLNDDRLISDCRLRDGDELCVGPLRFRVSADVPIHVLPEPTVAPSESAGENETIVNGELQPTDETLVNDDRMTDDEAARLLLDDDESSQLTATSEAVLRALDAIDEPPVPQPTSLAARDILRQMRRVKK